MYVDKIFRFFNALLTEYNVSDMLPRSFVVTFVSWTYIH